MYLWCPFVSVDGCPELEFAQPSFIESISNYSLLYCPPATVSIWHHVLGHKLMSGLDLPPILDFHYVEGGKAMPTRPAWVF
jgi:hypothetical protein